MIYFRDTTKYEFHYKQSPKSLQTSYQRYLNCAELYLYYETSAYSFDEEFILNHFKEFRQKTPSGRLNEWLKIDFKILKNYLDDYFQKLYKNFDDVIDISMLFL